MTHGQSHLTKMKFATSFNTIITAMININLETLSLVTDGVAGILQFQHSQQQIITLFWNQKKTYWDQILAKTLGSSLVVLY